MTMTNTERHSLLASTYLQRASELARQEHDYDPETKGQYAQTMALVGVGEAILALVALQTDDGGGTVPVGPATVR